MGVTIDLNAIRENKRRIEALGRPVFAVVKNNAYNLGMEPVVTTLYAEGVRHFMVTTLDEGSEVRVHAPEANVLVMNPVYEWSAVHRDGLDVAIGSYDWLVSQRHELDGVRLHLKLDVGMNRFGAKTFEEALAILAFCQDEKLDLVGLCTHFPLADADNAEIEHSVHVERFADWSTRLIERHSFEVVHAANSAATLQADPRLGHCTHVRVGIFLYGYSSVEAVDWLVPAFYWETEVVAVHDIEAGAHVGYGTGYTAPSKERIAVLSVGYGDGLMRARRHLPVHINGRAFPFVSNIFMSHSFLRVDETVQIGDRVELYGNETKIDDVTRTGHANNSEQLCARSWRVPHRFEGGILCTPATNPFV
ncbi:alanine racemase [Exiguobacterium sp. SH3S2]|uniref:alanine racemase n=1 Tax=unclassified Exiguobacterium TaxID=2644629 RepID=UPI00103C721A|nr:MULTISPECIES: alanine racemase [unclassified Exiguobacterium]TCI44497.1 alanine racemase [Exiguobacterium sp. SH3S3]TCI60054.1 alanine racemase [Exiguobacterium sp. SH3S2]